MQKIRAVLAAALLALAPLPSAFARATPAAIQAANNVLGDVVAVDASSKQIFVKTDAGAVVIITVSDSTKILKNPPGETKLDKATPYTLAQIATGDRVLALGKLSDDGKTLAAPRAVVVNTKAELTTKQEAERAEWRKRGVVGVVSAVNADSKEITIQTRTPEGPKPVIINASAPAAKLTRYAPDSIKFADRKPAEIAEIKVGDQLRAKGDKSEDGARFTPEEVVTGTFRTEVGTVKSVDAAKNEIVIESAQSKKTLTVVVRPDSVLKQFQLPPEAMAMMGGGGGMMGGGGGGQAGAPGGGGGPQRVVMQGGPEGNRPFSKEALVQTLKSGAKAADVAQLISQRGVRFKPSADDVKELRDAGATDEVIKAVNENFKQGMVEMSGPGGGGQGQGGAGQPQGGPGGGAPGGQAGGGPRRMMMSGDFMQQMLERMPAVTVGELKPGTMILVSSTAGADPTRLTAIQLVSNIEPVVQMMAMMNTRRTGGSGGTGPAPSAGGGGLGFGFGIGQP
jgi:transcription antitermination factor NusG